MADYRVDVGRRLFVACVVVGLALATAAVLSGVGRSADRTTDLGVEPAASPSASGLPSATPGPELLLPNLRSLPARDFQLRPTDGRTELRFEAVLANLGPGPLIAQPGSGPPCPAGQVGAAQVVYVDVDRDGRFSRTTDRRTQSVPAGCMLDHPTHDHWHFDAMAGYSLHRTDGMRLSGRDKVSFCLRDNRRVRVGSTARRHYGDCSRDTIQGISPGWVDVYDVETDGQFVVLPPALPDGIYCLRTAADPGNLLDETDESDNAAVVRLRLTADGVTALGTSGCARALD